MLCEHLERVLVAVRMLAEAILQVKIELTVVEAEHMLLIILGHVLLDLLADLVHATEVVDLLGAPHSVLHDDLTQAMLDKVQHEVLHIDLFLCEKHALALK